MSAGRPPRGAPTAPPPTNRPRPTARDHLPHPPADGSARSWSSTIPLADHVRSQPHTSVRNLVRIFLPVRRMHDLRWKLDPVDTTLCVLHRGHRRHARRRQRVTGGRLDHGGPRWLSSSTSVPSASLQQLSRLDHRQIGAAELPNSAPRPCPRARGRATASRQQMPITGTPSSSSPRSNLAPLGIYRRRTPGQDDPARFPALDLLERVWSQQL